MNSFKMLLDLTLMQARISGRSIAL